MASGHSSEPESLRHRAALTFALASVLPLLLFLYVVDRYSLLMKAEVSLLLGMSVLIAVLGFTLLMRTMKQITALAEDFVRLEQGELDELVISDTIPTRKDAKKITVLTASTIIGEAIRRIHNNESVNSIFNA